ncbi:MAG TPA: penicillin-binding transpeptidase domain-containing protein [Planctomycetota bacterium]|nr:penicillin-binding transpeptidase domain-containing protein [Planctomycetota bacterium]
MLRRFLPLMLCVVLALLVLVSRLYEVSVEEHPIWAREAASLERSAHLVPYRRGRILDRKGREWVRDEVRYEIEFVWRDFRRGHPLGNIAQLMSLTLMRPVDLEEVAGGDAALWADHLVSLSPAEIRTFGRGGELRVGGVDIAALPEKGRRGAQREERRAARAESLRFYIERLLQVDRREWRALRDLRDSDRAGESYASLVAGLRQEDGESTNAATQRLRRELRMRVDRSLQYLDELGQLVDWSDVYAADEVMPPTTLERVVQILDVAREESENLAADRLFAIAAGFPASQLSLASLRLLDLEWLKKCLYWDEPRIESWRVRRGGQFAQQVPSYVAGYVFARMQLADGEQANRVLDALAHEFVDPSDRPDPRKALVLPWQRADHLRILSELDDALEAPIDSVWLDTPVLPVQDPSLRKAGLAGLDLLDACLQPDEVRYGGLAARQDLSEALLQLPGVRQRRTDWKPGELEPVEQVLLAWNDRLETRVEQIFEDLPQPVRFDSDAIRAALEDRDHVIKDMSSRPMRFSRNPSQEMVHHVERYHQDYAGLQVKSVRSRAAAAEAWVANDDPEHPERLLAGNLIGKVRSPKLVSLLERGAQERQAQEILRQVELDEADREFVVEAAAESFLPSQTVGGSGIEGYFDPELRGRNGFREVVGLEETHGKSGRRPLYQAPQDGQDLTLTLDMDLQEAAEFVINHPEPPPAGEIKYDPEWLRFPVGAIVAIRVDGEVLAAASAPVVTDDGAPHQDGQRKLAIERTLRMPTFQPPGSILKPLVAAWALEYLGLNPGQPRVICKETTTTKKKPGAGWGAVGCHAYYGHSTAEHAQAGQPDIDLETAIRVSCNTYFAQLGETLYDEHEFQKMLAAFGLGKRTGILNFGLEGRGGWLEEFDYKPLEAYTPIQRQRLGNGLSHIVATPMQMARAYAGLATGRLPEIHVVERIGDQALPPHFDSLPIAEHNLAVVRHAMEAVVEKSGGSAHSKGLSEADLGFRFVCKTGSADYIAEGEVPDFNQFNLASGGEGVWHNGVRKHTWVAGWFPAEDPKVVVVAYIHDTSTTSSHGAVYVMAQFLRHPAVRAYLEGAQ